jgi:preflagellin peptidase FlaK
MGYRISVEKAKEKFVWPMERFVDGKLKMSYMPKDFDIKEELALFEKKGIKKIWVTPKIPFMIPLLAGYIVSFTFGNIVFHYINPAF